MNAGSDFDILGFGALAVDDLLYVDEYPGADGKVRVRRRERIARIVDIAQRLNNTGA